ncbi:hypothetical protein DITRI_Ditri12bG0106100 [Diplodiscus trichospermus]
MLISIKGIIIYTVGRLLDTNGFAREFWERKPAQGLATILSIGKANPANYISQADFPHYYFKVTKSEHMIELKEKFNRICDKSTKTLLTRTLSPNVTIYNGKNLDISQQFLVSEVPKLALEAASKAIEEWGQPKSQITHLVFSAIADVDMPGADYRLAKLLDLPSSVKRVMMYFQGCYASGTMLRMAKDFAENNVGSRVLVVSSDISIGTFRAPNEHDTPSLICNETVVCG